ncbi:hypothetical protein GGF43_006743, partial [Coemansia sp. RSA 2618]
EFAVSMEVAQQSELVKTILAAQEDAEKPIVLEKVEGEVLAKVIEYCEYHQSDKKAEEEDDAPKRSDDISTWDKQFMKVEQEMLFKLLTVSNDMDIKPLLDLGCKTVANMIRSKSAKEIRTMFNIVDDFTDEERKQIKE